MSTSEVGGTSKSNYDGVCEVIGKLDNMSITIANDVSVCANCGKGEEGSASLKACTACKLVKYCNRECQIAHRPQHKKECKKRAAELHDEVLFKQPPPKEDCPICFLRMPTLVSGQTYMPCCGQVICCGCMYAPVYDNQGKEVAENKCAFCRVAVPKSHEEAVERLKKRYEADDAEAIHITGCYYAEGFNGFRRDHTKALELWHRAGELGYTAAYHNIGRAYELGEGVDVDKKKAIHYYELAAMGGNIVERNNLGVLEELKGNVDRALKHFMIAVRDGYAKSLNRIKLLYSGGHLTKEDYTKALQLYQTYLGEIKSDQRDKAAAADDHYRYY